MDQIVISNFRTKAVIGVYCHERRKRQKIIINIHLFLDTKLAGINDDIEESVDYAQLMKQMDLVVMESKRYTVEALAEDISQVCLQFQKSREVIVKIEKPRVIKGVEKVGVEIRRSKT